MFRVIWSEPDEWWPRYQDFAAGPIIHEPGCGWETGPRCTCGADPGRMDAAELAAHAFAAETTKRVGDGVEVHRVGGAA